MKKLVVVITSLMFMFLVNTFVGAQDVNDFEIIPKNTTISTDDIVQDVEDIGKGNADAELYGKDTSVIDRYRNKADERFNKSLCNALGWARATGVFNRNLILCYFKYVVKFLSQVGLVIGALMIIYAGYLYASAVFAGSNPQKGATAIKNAILGLLIVIFSYAILKILTSMFL